jgi:DnaK suppressor protein
MPTSGVRAVLLGERDRTIARVAALSREFDGIVEAADLVATDDEHDPEGHTIAFERQQVAGLLREAHARLVAVDLALERVDAGRYGTCEICGCSIPTDRLAARPEAATCVPCAV